MPVPSSLGPSGLELSRLVLSGGSSTEPVHMSTQSLQSYLDPVFNQDNNTTSTFIQWFLQAATADTNRQPSLIHIAICVFAVHTSHLFHHGGSAL